MSKSKFDLLLNQLTEEELACGFMTCLSCQANKAKLITYAIDKKHNSVSIRFQCTNCGFIMQFEGDFFTVDSFMRTYFHRPTTIFDLYSRRK